MGTNSKLNILIVTPFALWMYIICKMCIRDSINCYDTGTAPCKTACPAHVAVQGYLKMAAQGRYQDALALIKKNNPLPAVCGHVCNRRCEDACTRGTIDQAIAIDEVRCV